MLKKEDIKALNWANAGDLMPAIVQDACSGQVLMLGFMNREAVAHPRQSERSDLSPRHDELLLADRAPLELPA